MDRIAKLFAVQRKRRENGAGAPLSDEERAALAEDMVDVFDMKQGLIPNAGIPTQSSHKRGGPNRIAPTPTVHGNSPGNGGSPTTAALRRTQSVASMAGRNNVRNNTTTTGRHKLQEMEARNGITNSSGNSGATPNSMNFFSNNRTGAANNASGNGSRAGTRPGSRNTTAGGADKDLNTGTLLRNLSMKNINDNSQVGAGVSQPGMSRKRNASVSNLGGKKAGGSYPQQQQRRLPGQAPPPPAKQPPLLEGQGHLSIAEQAYLASVNERRRGGI